jgi:hypothetical protein
MAVKKSARMKPEHKKAIRDLWRKEELVREGIKHLEVTDLNAMRDFFAASALTGLCATRAQHKLESIGKMTPELAAIAYLAADAMLAMRKFSSKQLAEFIDSRNKEP